MQRKGKRCAEVYPGITKICTRCQNELELSDFAKAARGALGVSSICKACRISDRKNKDANRATDTSLESRRIEKINALLAMGPAKSTTTVEDDAICLLVEEAHCIGLEVKKWHDGTRSDVGIRPLGCSEDLWYALQVKSTAAIEPKFQWNLGRKTYDIPVLLVTGTPHNSFIMYPDDLVLHKEKIERCQGMIHYAKGPGYWKNAIRPRTTREILKEVETLWNAENSLADKGFLKSEDILQMQCSLDSQREWFVTSLVCRFSHASVHSRPSHQGTVDRFEDGVGIQDKSAAWMPAEDTAYFKAKCAKLLRGVEIPYDVGDAKVYCFAVVVERMRLLLEWRIPEDEMDTTFNRLSHVVNGKVSKLGRTCLNLPVVGPSGENHDLHQQLFGRMPRKDTDLRPALFLNVHRIPESIDLPMCVRNRDPVPRNS